MRRSGQEVDRTGRRRQGLDDGDQRGHGDPRHLSRLRRASTASTKLLAEAYLAKGDKPAAIAELERYAEDRRPRPGVAEEAGEAAGRSGPQEGSRRRRSTAELHLSAWTRSCTSSLGDLWLAQGNVEGRDPRVSQPCWRRSRIDPAAAHYNLARAYHAGKQDDEGRKTNCWPRSKPPRASGRRRRCLLELITTSRTGNGQYMSTMSRTQLEPEF